MKQNWSGWGYVLKGKLEPLKVKIHINPTSLADLNTLLGTAPSFKWSSIAFFRGYKTPPAQVAEGDTAMCASGLSVLTD